MREFRSLKWVLVHRYDGKVNKFQIYGCPLEGIAVVHDYKSGQARFKVAISYRVFGRSTDSPTAAVKYYNAELRKRGKF